MPFRSQPKRLFVIAVSLILASGMIATIMMYVLFASERWVRHTYQVQLRIARIGTDLAYAGRSRSAFLESGKPEYLAEFAAARVQLTSDLVELRSLSQDNLDQQARCSLMENNANARVRVLQDSVDLQQSGRSTPEEQTRLTGQVVSLAFESASISDEMQRAEDLLLENRRIVTSSIFAGTVFLVFLILLLAVVLLRKHYKLLAAELLERRAAEQNAQQLSIELMKTQDQEHRKFSRELHDGLGQVLSAAKMVADRLDRNGSRDEGPVELSILLEDALSQTRTLSHLLHPPLLDELGFVCAAREFIENYSRRTGIAVKFDCPEKIPELPKNLGLTLFRVLQESLTNVQRHSKSEKANVTVSILNGRVSLRIRDYGVGIPPATLVKLQTTGAGVGVGLSGMKGRTKEQGGTLSIDSDSLGTVISASFELHQESAVSESD